MGLATGIEPGSCRAAGVSKLSVATNAAATSAKKSETSEGVSFSTSQPPKVALRSATAEHADTRYGAVRARAQ